MKLKASQLDPPKSATGQRNT